MRQAGKRAGLLDRPPGRGRLLFPLTMLMAGAAGLYAVAPHGPAWLEVAVTLWVPVLINALVAGMLLQMVAAMDPGPRRSAWRMVLIGVCFNLLASMLWIGLSGTRFALDLVSDLLSLVYYPLGAAAGVMFFLDLGGSFRRWTTWLDIVTLALGIGVLLWLFFLYPRLPQNGHGMERTVLIGYALGNGLVLLIALLVAMRISDWREQCSLAILVLGAIVGSIGAVGWIGSAQPDEFEQGTWYSIVGLVIPYFLLGLAIHFERRGAGRSAHPELPGEWQNFLPSLIVLLVIALLFAELGKLQGLSSVLLIVSIVAGAVLVGLQHRDLRFEFDGLKKALALQSVEIGLSELVRRSADLIVQVNPDRRVVYASPAAIDVVGSPAAALRVAPAASLLGARNEYRMSRLLDDILVRRVRDAEFETSFVDPAGQSRAVRVVGSCQLDNPAIAGAVLTLHDITEEQRLEREVLDCASRERGRLSADVHDGVGQELTGIALLLKSLDPQAERVRGSLIRSLSQIEQHVNETIRLTQRLESGLAPLPTGSGSLEGMLEHLAADSCERFGLDVTFSTAIASVDLDPADAEHLYRIAQESINNAARHSGCRHVQIRIDRSAGGTELLVDDDGCGWREADAGSEGLGLRMMGYRARILGATLQVEPLVPHGTRVSVLLAPDVRLPDGALRAGGGRS